MTLVTGMVRQMSEDEYYTIRTDSLSDVPVRSRPRPLRAVLLFATAAVALTVLVAPQLGETMKSRNIAAIDGMPNIDNRATGAVPRAARPAAGNRLALERARLRGVQNRSTANGSTYTVRRSVLSRQSVCVIRQDGSRTGSC